MQENIIGSRIASFIVLSRYNKIMDLSLGNMEDSDIFKEEMAELKRLFLAEFKEYNRITSDEAEMYFKNMNEAKIRNLLDMREYKKIRERKRILDGNLQANGYLISSIIAGKIYIDSIKDVNDTIKRLRIEGKIDDDDLYMLNLYLQKYKYHYLSSNNFVETIAIEKEFNLDNIECISFEDIENTFGITFIDNSQYIFYDFVSETIKELVNLQSDDANEIAFLSMLYVGKVKSLLPYLDYNSLTKLSYQLNDNSYKYERNSALVKVKKLIIKRQIEESN